MKEKIKAFTGKISVYFSNIKAWPLKKKIIRLVLLLVLIFIVWNILKPKTIDPKLITVVPVENKDIISTVKASGQVTSVTDLNLSFKASDLVDNIYVSVGERAYKGQVLATLKNGNEAGAVTQARASLASAKASLDRTIEGSTTEEVRVAEVALNSAKNNLNQIKRVQDSLVNSARQTLYSAGLVSVSTLTNSNSEAPTISGTYLSSDEDEYTISVYPSGSGSYASVTSLRGDSGPISINTSTSLPLGSKGLYIKFPASFQTSNANDTWKVKVPNTSSSVYNINLINYNNAIENRISAIASLRAERQQESALGNYENTIIRAPANGTITKVDIKVGELAKSMETVIVVQDISKLYVEANINESNITEIKNDQDVEFTIDAFGPERKFAGKVTQVEPGATIENGIVNYKIKASLNENQSDVKPGMNANLTVTTGSKFGVIAIPNASVENRDGKKFVKVITNESKKTYIEREVVTGAIGSGNLVEIVSGLNVGEKVALIEKASK